MRSWRRKQTLEAICWAADWGAHNTKAPAQAHAHVRAARDLACVDAIAQGVSIEDVANALGCGEQEAWDCYWAGVRMTAEPKV